MLKNMLLLLSSIGLILPLSAFSQVREFSLPNGMKILVKEDHRAPVVTTQIWYKVGSSYEPNGITGVSHVLEHMMFKGTKKYPAGEFSRIIAENGGSENAFTGRDYTAYFQTMEKSRLPISLELEADRMRNLILSPEEFAKEVNVVMEERRLRTEDKPRSLTSEHFRATAFTNSPYRNPIIGWMDDLENLTVEDLKPWYDRWYAPNNATLVVVGDVDSNNVFELAKKYFSPLQPSNIQPIKPMREVLQSGKRKVSMNLPARLPFLIMGYKVPVVTTASETWEPYALEVLAGIFSGSSSARFPRELERQQQIAVSVDVGYDLYARMSDLFTIDATPAEGHTMEEVKKEIQTQINKLVKGEIKPQELARIKAQVVASKVYERDSVFYQAMQLGMLETVGISWKESETYAERIRAVTAKQVQSVAKKYLVADSLTVAYLNPQSITQIKPVNHKVKSVSKPIKK
jgi:zinc protease